jgi:hypothetical protein
MELERINAIRPDKSKYEDDFVDQALLHLVLNDYNVRRTVRELTAAGMKVPEKTLAGWRDAYPRRLQFHATETARELEERIVTKHRAVASAALDGVMLATEKEVEKIKAGDVRDYAASARNLATTSAISTDKLLALTGRPSSIVQHDRKPEAILARLASLGVVDSTAEVADD